MKLSSIPKTIFIVILTVIAISYTVITYPFFWLKRKIFGLDTIKTDIISTLNTFYGINLEPSNYRFDNNILPGLKISKQDNVLTTLAKSQKVEKGTCFAVIIDNNKDDFGFPVVSDIKSSLNQLSKVFTIKQTLYIHFEKRKMSRVQLRIELSSIATHKLVNPFLSQPARYRYIIQVEFTPDFKVVSIQKINHDDDVTQMLQTKKTYKDFPLSDFLLLVYLKMLSNREDINALLPEINTPSAYDFNSDDFQQRLVLVEMMEY
jgi:hypothetical protein